MGWATCRSRDRRAAHEFAPSSCVLAAPAASFRSPVVISFACGCLIPSVAADCCFVSRLCLHPQGSLSSGGDAGTAVAPSPPQPRRNAAPSAPREIFTMIEQARRPPAGAAPSAAAAGAAADERADITTTPLLPPRRRVRDTCARCQRPSAAARA